jgi:cyclophilin family peptidyl-prolyl cis-trans isomerase
VNKYFILCGIILFSISACKEKTANSDTQAIASGVEPFKANQDMIAMVYTNKGLIKLGLEYIRTPMTVANFVALAEGKMPNKHKPLGNPFYDGLKFHRIVENFMIQTGDPLGNGTGNPGYMFADEFHEELSHDGPGILSMANSGKNTNGSQFFINLVTNSPLNNKHTVFGMVTENFSVVQAIGLVPTNASDKPLTDVVIDSIRITNLYSNVVGNVGSALQTKVSPNPCRGVATVTLPQVATTVTITNMAGETVYETTGTGRQTVDLREQPGNVGGG